MGGNKIIVYMVLFEPMELYCLRFVASFVPANAFLLLLEAQVYNVYGTQTPPSHEKMRRKAREKREHFWHSLSHDKASDLEMRQAYILDSWRAFNPSFIVSQQMVLLVQFIQQA